MPNPMNASQGNKYVQIVAPQAVKDNTEFVGSKGSTPISVDTAGFRWMDVIVMFGAMDIAMATMKLYSSPTDSVYTAVSDYSTLPLTLPSASDDNHFFVWRVDLTKKSADRYYQVELIPGDGAVGTYAVCWAVLSNAEQCPNTAATRGFTQEAYV